MVMDYWPKSLLYIRRKTRSKPYSLCKYWFHHFLKIYFDSFTRFPTLSTKCLAPKDWKFLPFSFNARLDLEAPLLIEAAPDWIFWEFMLTSGLFVSGSNTHLVRKRVKQHPAVNFDILSYWILIQQDWVTFMTQPYWVEIVVEAMYGLDLVLLYHVVLSLWWLVVPSNHHKLKTTW